MPARLRAMSMLLVALLAAAPGVVSAADSGCGAAYCVPSDYWGSGVNAAGVSWDSPFRAGQTFTPLFAGALGAVKLGLFSQDPGVGTVEVRTVAGGLPTTTVLGSAPIPGAPYHDGQLYAADFSGQGVVLLAGTRYAIVVRTDVPGSVVDIDGTFTQPCAPAVCGTNDFVTSDDGGLTWAIWPYDHRAFVYEVCLDAATPTRGATWGRLKAVYR